MYSLTARADVNAQVFVIVRPEEELEPEGLEHFINQIDPYDFAFENQVKIPKNRINLYDFFLYF